LSAEHLRPALRSLEERVPARATQSTRDLLSLSERFRQVSDYRARIGHYPIWCLLRIVALLGFQQQVRSAPAAEEMVVIDGKKPRTASRERHKSRSDV
jgi:hypothetical protein